MSDLARYMQARTAGSSWRPFSATAWWDDYDVVIGSDGGPHASYDAYVGGMQIASRPSLTEAKYSVEKRVGSALDWVKVDLEPVSPAPGSYTEMIWGETDEFSSPTVLWAASLP